MLEYSHYQVRRPFFWNFIFLLRNSINKTGVWGQSCYNLFIFDCWLIFLATHERVIRYLTDKHWSKQLNVLLVSEMAKKKRTQTNILREGQLFDLEDGEPELFILSWESKKAGTSRSCPTFPSQPQQRKKEPVFPLSTSSYFWKRFFCFFRMKQ